MGEQERILEAVGLVYAAAVNVKRWPAALAKLSNLVGASGATLLFNDANATDVTIMQSTGIDPDDLARCEDYYFARPIRLQIAFGRAVGAVSTNAHRLLAPSLQRTEFVNDFREHADLPYMIASVLLKEGHAFSSLAFHWPRRRGDYSEGEKRVLRALVPHLQRAISIHRQLFRAEMTTSAGLDALDGLARGVILVDPEGHALFINRAAREILDENDGLALVRDRLQASRPELTRALRGLLRDMRLPGIEGTTESALVLPRPSIKRPLTVFVKPIVGCDMPFLSRTATAAVFLKDPERATKMPPGLLEQLYDLTRAEARLAALLMEGHAVGEASERLTISPLTARTQLKSVMQKTKTHRQGSLIRLLMAGPGQLRGAS